MKVRRQLTLFLDKKDAEIIELVRTRFNPVQKNLIDAHVTLCREDEIEDVEKVLKNIEKISDFHLEISFGKPEKFSGEKGVFLLATSTFRFDELRKKILSGIVENPRKQEPHITLMHPRNSTCIDEIFQEILKYKFPENITFTKISLIEQANGEKWATLKTFDVGKI